MNLWLKAFVPLLIPLVLLHHLLCLFQFLIKPLTLLHPPLALCSFHVSTSRLCFSQPSPSLHCGPLSTDSFFLYTIAIFLLHQGHSSIVLSTLSCTLCFTLTMPPRCLLKTASLCRCGHVLFVLPVCRLVAPNCFTIYNLNPAMGCTCPYV